MNFFGVPVRTGTISKAKKDIVKVKSSNVVSPPIGGADVASLTSTVTIEDEKINAKQNKKEKNKKEKNKNDNNHIF